MPTLQLLPSHGMPLPQPSDHQFGYCCLALVVAIRSRNVDALMQELEVLISFPPQDIERFWAARLQHVLTASDKLFLYSHYSEIRELLC